MYLMCGAFRLARFNLQATRPRVLIGGTPKVDKKNFVGLPIPPAAGLMAAIVHFAPTPLTAYGEATARYYTYSMMTLITALSVLMVSTVKYSSMKTVGLGRRNLYLVLVIAATGMLIFLYSKYMLLILAGAYVSHGVLWYLFGLVRPRSRTAEHNEAEA
jgi:CDP-diacylglycerol--serine O-phosphatidyltransferase